MRTLGRHHPPPAEKAWLPMNFDDYEKRYEAVYAEFAATVRLVLEKATASTTGVPR